MLTGAVRRRGGGRRRVSASRAPEAALTATRPAGPREAGFTLIELILSIGLLGLVFSVLSLVMMSAVRANQETEDRVTQTRDEQFTAAYFATDVAGATEVVTGAAARCGTGTAVVELVGVSFAPGSPPVDTVTVASYVFTTATVDGVPTGTVTRHSCEAAGTPTSVPAFASPTTVTVAHTLAPTPPVVTCSTDGTAAACSADTTTISVSFDRLSGGDPFVLSATRRTTP